MRAVITALALLLVGADAFTARTPMKMALAKGSTITVLGPGNKQVQLLAAKLACKNGYKANLLIDDGELANARTLTYGRNYARAGADEPNNVQFAIGAEGLGKALSKSDGIILVGDYKEIPQKLIDSTVVAAPGLKRIALLSEHGASKGGGGKTSEEYLKSVAESKGFEWSIARGGLLKGGGPGNVDRGDDYGLDVYFYDTNPELNSFQKDKFSDQYLMGAKISKGDVLNVSPFQKVMAANSMSSAAVGVTNRCAMAAALVQSLGQEACTNSDFGVDSIRGLAPPTQRSWDEAFATMAETGEAATLYIEGEQPAVERKSKAAKWRDEAKERAGLDVDELAAPVSYKLGASTREEELVRKQIIGHIIPGGFALAAVLKGVNVFNFFESLTA
uniref:Uncharacterized protein n=1 Tax=Florenciella parvula TaxID=236787 RepID=A0A7S2BLE2_9STRA|mmetsp:Transcript_17918/g.37473  ORF Transcript_17918/g.37473 Transcript_17918/m.37473 type:complete len:390 (+) Transcript_17918:35-1204(+)|eukprot:CAMPEP_0119479650 /NCGR_PEP_ID=MMETSP1344-20130328/8821_1 /TAXON_ID=236787 /ORGANISM="Florenciella parvula, Strain CCMP2471" /LENGTH=389 /DNA_ID=CAMNT_0007513897 /DNA_START=12 /DNA_END=1181 /DNA_ORIENTATION=-